MSMTENKIKDAQDAAEYIGDEIIGEQHDTFSYIEYPNSTFLKLNSKWFQVTTHEVKAPKLINRLEADNK